MSYQVIYLINITTYYFIIIIVLIFFYNKIADEETENDCEQGVDFDINNNNKSYFSILA